MIRLSVEQLHELQRSIQATGEVNATVLPRNAFATDRLFIAWARSISQEEFYLAIWKDEKSWEKAAASGALVDIFSEGEKKEYRKKIDDVLAEAGNVDAAGLRQRIAEITREPVITDMDFISDSEVLRREDWKEYEAGYDG
jgi:hypothetical protein